MSKDTLTTIMDDDTVVECKEGLREMFKSIDSNKNGLIDAMELLRVCHQNNIQITKPLAVRILTLPDKTVGFNIAKFCELLKDCPSTNIVDSIYFLQQLVGKVAGCSRDEIEKLCWCPHDYDPVCAGGRLYNNLCLHECAKKEAECADVQAIPAVGDIAECVDPSTKGIVNRGAIKAFKMTLFDIENELANLVNSRRKRDGLAFTEEQLLLLNSIVKGSMYLGTECSNDDGQCHVEKIKGFIEESKSSFTAVKEAGSVSSGFLQHFILERGKFDKIADVAVKVQVKSAVKRPPQGIEEDVPANIDEAGEFPTVLPEPPVPIIPIEPIIPIVPIMSGMSSQFADEHINFEIDHLPAVCSPADPQFIPHATDCSSYYQCAPGHAPVKYTCAAPTRWNAKINNCDYNVPCPSAIDANWTPFSDWSVCSKTCGGEVGQKVRTRTCIGGEDCLGQSEEVESCVEFENCPCIGTVSEWECCSSTSPCKKNEGDCDRDSDCVGSLVCGTDNCKSINPLAHRKADCCIQPAIDGNWTPFSDWSACSKTCGGEEGQKVRTRTCTNPPPDFGGEDCLGQSKEVESCVEFKNCPVGTSAVGTCDSGTICGQVSLEPITDDIKKARKYACMLGDVEFIKPLNPNNPKNVKNAEAIVSEQKLEELFPNRNAAYTYENFLKAIGKFPSICAKAHTCKKILANMFGHFGQETAGLKYVEEIQKGRYCGSQEAWALEAYPCQKGAQYYGRGSKQLTHNYNYGAFSNAMFGTPMLLLNQPELVATTWLNFASGMWFFVTPQSPKPSILDVVEGRWQPNSVDKASGLVNGFGTSIRIINGGQECGSGAPHPEKAVKRAEYYMEYANKLELDISGEQLSCASMGKFSTKGSNGAQKLYWNSLSCNAGTWQSPYNALVEGDYARCLKISLDVTKVVPPECIPQAVTPVIIPENWISSGPNKGRCGAGFEAPSGVVAECDPNSIDRCCSTSGYCGHTDSHCNCDGCKKFT